jgi:hypothetical protein
MGLTNPPCLNWIELGSPRRMWFVGLLGRPMAINAFICFVRQGHLPLCLAFGRGKKESKEATQKDYCMVNYLVTVPYHNFPHRDEDPHQGHMQ